MVLKRWEDLPDFMKNDAVRPYYEKLKKRRAAIFIKRIFDIIVSGLMILILSPVFLILVIKIKADDHGPAFFRQVRITRYGREFRIFKFRTMVVNADKLGAQVTSGNDPRVTHVGVKLRKYRLDELPQLFNVFKGDMSFVGTRPEVPRYVKEYSEEMMATLLMPAGVTSDASIMYKDESEIIGNADDPDKVYIDKVLPEKMKYNLEAVEDFSLGREFRLLFRTVIAVCK